METISREAFMLAVKKALKSHSFRHKTEKEIDAMCDSEDGRDFIDSGYQDYLRYTKEEPAAENNLSGAVYATVSNMYLWF